MKNGMKLFFTGMIMLVLLSVFTSGCTGGEKPAALVNGEKVTYSQLDKELEKRFGPRVLEEMIIEKLILQKAKQENVVVSDKEIEDSIAELKKNPQFAMIMKFQKISMDDLKAREKFIQTLKKLISKNITQEEKKKFFEKNKETLEKVKASHILVAKKEVALDILNQIKSGKDFSELAKKHSTDEGTKNKGGDLGSFAKQDMQPEFSKTAFKLKAGEISEPVKTKFGWHIIKVEEKFDTCDKLDKEIEEALAGRGKMRDYIEELKGKAKIENYLNSEESEKEQKK